MATEEEKLQKEQAKFDRERADAFAVMMKTQGWQLYCDLLNKHIATRTAKLFEPTPAGEEYAEQHNKGAVYGLLLARDIPSATVAAMKNSPQPAGDE